MTELTKEQFEKILNQGIHISPCKRCGNHPEIVVKYPWYGRTGAQLICPYCGVETKPQGINHTMICEDGRFGTPVTLQSMQNGIENAINVWEATCGEKRR